MTLTQVWGALLIFIVCPLLGGLPLIAWIAQGLTGKKLSQIGTGNISVSAAFYHGGRLVGILAVVSEALKGIAAVFLARTFFPDDRSWELIALIALVMGRYWMGRGAGTTNVVWGYVAHDPVVAGLTFLMSGIGFTILRERQQGRIGVLILFPFLTALRHSQDFNRILAAIALAGLLAWIYQKIPDDLDLQPTEGRASSQTMFRFFRGDRALISLDQPLNPTKVGQKAATLSQLKRWGYPVPNGWVLPPGDDPEPLLTTLTPSAQQPLVVRSSAIGEDSETASAAGQYISILNVISRQGLERAIARCLASYDAPAAVQYRVDRGLEDASMSVIIQQQVHGVASGVAFSRDPIARQGNTVVIEALPGGASDVVSGKVTPESYRVLVYESDLQVGQSWELADDQHLPIEGQGNIPLRLIQQVAYLSRHLEARYHGIPQDIEWSYDGETLWVLQARPITTLLPIWTRKIAAEVIPGAIRPLTWSINRPLTCGVWGSIFTIVLGQRVQGIDFNETATLHSSHAYFNASLLGEIFRCMGLPPESLEFLTRGVKFSKPPLGSTVRNLPGLLRLLSRELRLVKDFEHDYQIQLQPMLAALKNQVLAELSATELLKRIEGIQRSLRCVTYYSIFVPLSVALRKAIRKAPEPALDYSQSPEVAAMRSLQTLAQAIRQTLPSLVSMQGDALFQSLQTSPDGEPILQQFQHFLDQYGYLSEVGTDIAVPTWQEDSGPVKAVLAQFLSSPLAAVQTQTTSSRYPSLQQRLDLKGTVTEVYSRLLAELRWSFVALESVWLQSGQLTQVGDIFFLEMDEVCRLINSVAPSLDCQLTTTIAQRREQWQRDQERNAPPQLVYGQEPLIRAEPVMQVANPEVTVLRGIGASPGTVTGHIYIAHNLQSIPHIEPNTILVVPYTDSGWAPLLAQVAGIISEVGGQLSHGAIVAREYGIPAVMNIPDATQILKNQQRVRLNGQMGMVEILSVLDSVI
jgi:phosphoenolpyruvate synthase/pyruvate phosphate dikinase/glycerol-3-phosphate acyltransferase PlsY